MIVRSLGGRLVTAMAVCLGLALGACANSTPSPIQNQEESLPFSPGQVTASAEVYVTDEQGSPLTGVSVQLCSDRLCIYAETDDRGRASFAVEDLSAYTAHVIDVPEGFAEDELEHEFAPGESELTIVLARPSS